MNIGKPLCEVPECRYNAQDGFDWCLEHNPKYQEGRQDMQNELKQMVMDVPDKEETHETHCPCCHKTGIGDLSTHKHCGGALIEENVGYNQCKKDILKELVTK